MTVPFSSGTESTRHRRNPTWVREELILALDVYIRAGLIGASHPDVIELSQILRQLPIHVSRPDAEKFRNPNGVAKKLANFAALDPDYPGRGLERGGRLDAEIWDEFSNDRERLEREAQAIRAALANAARPGNYSLGSMVFDVSGEAADKDESKRDKKA